MTVKPSQKDLTAFGYSSSSEDEDEQLRKSNKSNNNTQNPKKKKKTKPPPQKSINKIWRHFSAKKFSRALSVLPFDPVPLPAEPERSNELLSAGYDRAVEECRRKVQKIIRECRRVNMRYRDPGWDVDWDLKMGKGNCLNYLGSSKFDINGPRLSSSTAVPKAVKRIHEIYEKPTFLADVNGSDIKQGFLGNCWLIASLSALANVKDGIRRICVEYDTRIGIYGFVFFRDGEWVYSIVDDKLYLTSPNWDSRDLLNQIDRDHEDAESWYRKTYQTGSKALFFGGNKSQNETWVPLIEKAYAKVHGDFASLIGGWIGEGVEDLSGGVTTELLASDILDLDGFWEDELSKVNEEFMFGCSTGLVDGGYGERNGIREGHAYVVMDARTLRTGERLVKLRNPWGKLKKGIWDGPWSDGSKEWTNEVKEELGHTFGNDSVFWLRYEDMLRKFLHFDRTRLFRDPDWRCCQRWIGVEVPWKAQYNEKFHITLLEESPLVIVLSQLDNRFYKGLHGQYHFRLHFRLHEQGSPGAEDYIVRSHGNYLMDRSVSIELPCMEPGKYSVFVSVTAERDTNNATVEDVVKRECKKRSDHDKLASVGYAYDLAHSKGVAHLEQVAKLRKQSDQKKASGSRMAERRKLWEKRHTNREINKAQQKKNREKAERRKEVKQEERKKKEAAERKKEEEVEAAERRKKEETEKATKQNKKGPGSTGDKTSQTEGVESEDNSVQPKTNEQSDKEKVEETNNAPSSPETPGEVSNDGTPKDGDSKDDDSKPLVEDAPKAENKEPTTASPAPPPQADTKPKSDASDDGDSSDSPVEDWELLYSSDDMSRKPRMAPAPAPAPASTEKTVETDEEAGLPDPWNAICVVGIRVYSKDERLGLRVVIEGGGLAENGMGQKGAQDIDNAQMNGAGERREPPAADGGVLDEVEIIDGAPVVKQRVKAGRAREQIAEDDRENEADSEDSDNEDHVATPDSASGDCTPQKRLGDSGKDRWQRGVGE